MFTTAGLRSVHHRHPQRYCFQPAKRQANREIPGLCQSGPQALVGLMGWSLGPSSHLSERGRLRRDRSKAFFLDWLFSGRHDVNE